MSAELLQPSAMSDDLIMKKEHFLFVFMCCHFTA